jgi:monomeric sarcosine oxidase
MISEGNLMVRIYDAAIIGAGAFGSWTAYHLQQRGLSVALIDAYGPGNSRASSGGESRIIRMGYGADEIYTRWSISSLESWRKFFDRIGQALFHCTGVLWLARENDPYSIATVSTLQKTGVNFARLSRNELETRYPQFNFGEIAWGILEPESGVLMARRAVRAVTREIVANGGDYFSEAVLTPSGAGRLNELVTRSGEKISARNFIFACGPWLPKIFPALLADKIHPTRQEVFFFGTPAGDSRFASPQTPTWIDFGAEVYGMPDLENRGVKLAIDRHGPAFDPETGDRTVSEELLSEARVFLAHRFPDLQDAPILESRVCQYENTSNGDFLIDRHPDLVNLWLIGGGSGHGFKHGPALGQYVAARIVDGGEVDHRFTWATKEQVRKRSVF